MKRRTIDLEGSFSACYLGEAGQGERMAEWVRIQDSGFIAADVIRWKESVYRPGKSRKGKAVRLGERLVTAEVLNEPDRKGFARLLVRKCEVLSEVTTAKLPPLSSATEIRRAGKTI